MFRRLRPDRLTAILLSIILFLQPFSLIVSADDTTQLGQISVSTDFRDPALYYSQDPIKPIVKGMVTLRINAVNADYVMVDMSDEESVKNLSTIEVLPGVFELEFNSDTYPEKSVHFVFKAYKDNEIKDNKSISLIVDRTVPIVSSIQPSGTTLSGLVTFTTSVTDYDLYKVVVMVDSLEACVISDFSGLPLSCQFDTTTMDNGSYTLSVYAEDKAGNYNSGSSETISINNEIETNDDIAPNINLISGIPSNNTVSRPTWLKVEFSDNEMLAETSFSFINDGNNPIEFCGSIVPEKVRYAECLINPYFFSGSTTLRLFAKDFGGNETHLDYPITIIADYNANFLITLPFSNSTHSNPIDIEGHIRDQSWEGTVNLYYKNNNIENLIDTITEFDMVNPSGIFQNNHLSFNYIWTPPLQGKFDIVAKFFPVNSNTPISEEIVYDVEFSGEPNPIDTTAPVFVSKDVTRDEGESLPSISEFVLSNPENLEVTCNLPLQSELVVNQPNLNKLIPVTCSVTDAAGNTTTSTSNLIVNNVQPQVVLIADPSTSVSENGLVTMYANILRGNSLFTYNWTGACSGSGSTTLLGLLPSQTVGRTQGSYICGIVVTDADGDTSAASVLLNFTTASNNAVAGSNNSNSNSTADTTDTTVDENSDSNTEDETTDEEEGQVEGVSTENTVSGPNSDTNVVPATNATSPLVVICLVAGGILIIGLLLFLFFRGEDEEETQSASAS